jgi:endonuclease YncB( thermonuclease family)
LAGQLVELHGIDAPELDQTFWWRGQQLVCGTMSLATLEALIAGVKVRCEVIERDRHGRLVAKVFSPNGVDIGRRLVSTGPGPLAGVGVPPPRRGRLLSGGVGARAPRVAG